MNLVDLAAEGEIRQNFFPAADILPDALQHQGELLRLDGAAAVAPAVAANVERNVVALDAPQMNAGLAERQFADGVVDDVVFAFVDGGCRQTEHRKTETVPAGLLEKIAQKPVIRAEIPPPAGYGVRFVNDGQTNFAAAQKGLKVRRQKQLRRQIQKRFGAVLNGGHGLHTLINGHRRVDADGEIDAALVAELAHLVVHQRDQRGNDQRNQTVLFRQMQRRELEEDGFARAGRRSDEDVLKGFARVCAFALVNDFRDDLPLRNRLRLAGDVRVLIELERAE